MDSIRILPKVSWIYNCIVIWFFIGEIKVISGVQEQSSSNLLLDEDNDVTFKDVVKRNSQLVKCLYPKDSYKRLSLDHKQQEGVQSFKISVYDINWMFLTDINLLLSEILFENQEKNDDLKLIQKFDIKCLYESGKLCISNDVCNVQIDNQRLPKLIDFILNFTKNQENINEKYSKLMVDPLNNPQ